MRAETFQNIISTVDELSRQYDSDPGHNEQVTALALAFFDALSPLHHYGTDERQILEIPGRLHDIGWSKTVIKGHHKISGKMILKMDISGLNARDKLACALVARYHTRDIPDASKHRKFASLTQANRNRVEWLAGILRIADALDSSHNSIIKRLRLEITDEALTIQLQTDGDCWDEMRRVRRKQDLLIKKTGRSIAYLC